MAQIRSLEGLPAFDPDDTMTDAVNGTTPTATTTDITYRNPDNGNMVVFHGAFTLDGGGNVTGGTVTGFDVSAGATLVSKGTGYAISATGLMAAIVAIPPLDSFNQLIYSNVKQIGSEDGDALFAFSGTLLGRGGNDVLFQLDSSDGPTGFIVMKGGKGDDSLTGSDNPTGSDLYGGKGNDELNGGETLSTLRGGKGDDELNASNAASSTLFGGDGNDLLSDGFGPATMRGGKGDDFFFLGDLNPDFIPGFGVKHDVIGLDLDDFVGVQAGILTKAQFLRGTAAATPEQLILYDPNSGNALFDADGSGPIAPVLFAVLPANLNMHAHNFIGLL